MSEVSDFTALLAINSSQTYRWNNPADLQTGAIVTYSFATSDTVPASNEGAYAANSFSAFTEAQKANFRDAADVFEAVAGLIFVEVESGGMIDIYSASGSGYGGWANYPGAGETYLSQGDLVIDGSGNYDEGSFEFTTLLHELGHAVGLEHPHDGEHTLHDDDDHFENTVMTYNIEWGDYPSELGVFDLQALHYMYGDAMDTTGWVFHQGDTYFEVCGADNSDVIMGVEGANLLKGLDGADELWGRDGADKLVGGKGKDVLNGMYGDDTLNGGKGDDIIYGSHDGSSGYYGDHDKLIGGSGSDKLYGQAGEDTLNGGRGSDTLDGGSHSDTLSGGKGADTLLGGSGNDTLKGDNGDDIIDGGTGSNTMTGGSGFDTFVFANASYNSWNRVTDYTVGEDTLDFSDMGYTADDVTHFQNGADTYVKVENESGAKIAYLENFDNADFSVDQMVF